MTKKNTQKVNASGMSRNEVSKETADKMAALDAKCAQLGTELDEARKNNASMQEQAKNMQKHYESQIRALQAQLQQAQAQVQQAQQAQQVQVKAKKKKKDRFGAFRKAKGGSLSSAPLMAGRRGAAGSVTTSLSSRLGSALEEDDIGGY